MSSNHLTGVFNALCTVKLQSADCPAICPNAHLHTLELCRQKPIEAPWALHLYVSLRKRM